MCSNTVKTVWTYFRNLIGVVYGEVFELVNGVGQPPVRISQCSSIGQITGNLIPRDCFHRGRVYDATQKDGQNLRRRGSFAMLWQLRMRTRELLRIMNCVQCNKCRLHGKISVMGVSTALQILVGGPDGQGKDPRQVARVEMATLLTALDKCCRAIDLCLQMQSS